MKRVISLVLIMMLMVSGLFVLTGCDKSGENGGNGNNKPKKDTAKITYQLGKGTISLNVPKKEDGTPKYEFTTEKPDGLSVSASVYLVTDTAMFGFSTSGLAYNTSKDYKEKYGETEATFDGYLAFMEDTSISSRPQLSGMEQFELNGRKALRYYNRAGGSGDYEYYGYFYLVGVDDIYKGSRMQMTVNYKTDKRPKEAKEFDEETLDIIQSLKVTANE